jgi:hypothetical protein
MLFSNIPAIATFAILAGTTIAGREQGIRLIRSPYEQDAAEKDIGVKAGDAAGSSGSVETYLGPECMGKPAGSKKPITLPYDRCLSMHSYSLRLLTPAICANGTRAKWARFEGSKCNYGEITFEDGFLDIADSDLKECKDMAPEGLRETKIGSMAFWCDGFGDVKRPDPNAPPVEEKPKPKAGSVSESACAGKAPFFRHPKTDTCVNLGTKKLKIYSSGICEDGTKAKWAKYTTRGCVGEPKETLQVGDELLEKCLDMTGTESYAFWCTGEGLGKEAKKETQHGTGRAGKGWVVNLLLAFASILLIGGVAAVLYLFRDQIQALLRGDGYSSIAL